MLRRGFFAQCGYQPGARDLGVGEGFLRGEGLADDDEERGGGVERRQNAVDLRAIDVGDEVRARAVGEILQGVGHHARAQVAATDADVHDIGDGLALCALPGAAAQRLGERGHAGEHGVHLGHHVMASHFHHCLGGARRATW